jgi:hypothetical protein
MLGAAIGERATLAMIAAAVCAVVLLLRLALSRTSASPPQLL